MKRNVTIHDVAQAAGVSGGTVHNALYGKKGVSDAVRKNILRISEELGYKPNMVASALKRKPRKIIVSFPEPKGDNRYYFTYLWKGYRGFQEELLSYNIEAIEVPYNDTREKSFTAGIMQVLRQFDNQIDGIITGGRFFEDALATLKYMEKRHIPIVLVSEEATNINCLSCIQSNHTTDGRLAAELLSSQLRGKEKILICAGDMLLPSNRLNAEGFEAYLKENQCSCGLVEIYGVDVYSQIVSCLKTDPDIKGLYSVNSRCSLLLARAVEELGLAGQVRLVGTDLFPESAEYMQKGVICNIIHKGVEHHARQGMRILLNYLAKNEEPEQSYYLDKSIVIFRSNLQEYFKG